MKIRINKKIIRHLNPCYSRFDNYLMHYSKFDDDILKFLDLENISHSDKLWVALRVMPRELVEVFAIDMAFAAQEYANASQAAAAHAASATDASTYTASATDASTYTAWAAYAAATNAAWAAYAAATNAAIYAGTYTTAHAALVANDAANAAAYAANARTAEQENQINILKYLIKTHKV